MNFLNKLIREGRAEARDDEVAVRHVLTEKSRSSTEAGAGRASRRVSLMLAGEDRDKGYDPYDTGGR